MIPLIYIFAPLFGLCIGSFLNVCIYRLPRGESVVKPSSHCPNCKARLSWYENIPLVSFVIQLGRCKHCKGPISIRYPTVELTTAMLSLAIAVRFPDPFLYVGLFLFFSAPLVAVVFIDLEHRIIPDLISIPGIFVGAAVHIYMGVGPVWMKGLDSLLGILVGGGALFLIGWLYERLRHREGMGGGDVKLAAMLGAFFGWRAVIFILLVSSILGTIVGIFYLFLSKKGTDHPIPYGPFLAVAGWVYLFYGTLTISWYLHTVTDL